MPQTEKPSSIDLACTHCRERKIRCGREKPRCSNCKRDGVECGYTTPGKRVNHIKLLCNNVNGLEGRLSTIEEHLSRLATALDSGLVAQSDAISATQSRSRLSSPIDDDDRPHDGTYTPLSGDHHVFRNETEMVDIYHGPSSLLAQCTRFRTDALNAANPSNAPHSRHASFQDTPATTPLQALLNQMCETAGAEEAFPWGSDASLTQLPPKQQVLVAQDQFFREVDYATDIFVQRHFLANLERVYSGPLRPTDEAWAICFKAIIMLVLGNAMSVQGSNALFSGFARSFLPNQGALVNSRLLTAPRLINVQTLLLLSVAGQQFDPPGWAELLFAQACTLARTMGLYHSNLLPNGVNGDELHERQMTLRALYLRDKSLSTFRGSVSWLSSRDCDIASQAEAAPSGLSPYYERMQLALAQDDVLSMLQRAGPITSKATYSRIEQRLDGLAKNLSLFDAGMPFGHPRRATLQLEFMATRINALLDSTDQRHKKIVLTDSRVSCMLLLVSLGNQDPQLLDRYQNIMARRGSTPGHSPYSTNGPSPNMQQVSLPTGNVLDSFAVPAFFTLVKNLLWPSDIDGAINGEHDQELLRRVRGCYSDSSMRAHINNYNCKIGWTFDGLLKVVDLVKNGRQPSPISTPPSAPLMQARSSSASGQCTPQMQAMDYVTASHSRVPASQPTSGQVTPQMQPMEYTVAPQKVPEFDLSNVPTWPTPPSSNTGSWENWSGAPQMFHSGNMTSIADTHLIANMNGYDARPDAPRQMTWPAARPDSVNSRKRQRTETEFEQVAAEHNQHHNNFLTEFIAASPEMPFNMIA
ncbi:hypothetical protein K431DRAFT_305156 [Polychaeton citri CBS 116435]|uniref:Zn(2)-C6 fungal-type domain-containing protein n=1 Tax=Polychaeton citri CBS 116435 TaxID=1314669 RepID=A0A9P4Q7G6_9PEZI|nr:hypothetical protein K431DRAFT_305156 [Polychaeton citri CBS 116435]